MTSEKDAWNQLIDSGVLTGAELFSPTKAGNGYYSDLLKRHVQGQDAKGWEHRMTPDLPQRQNVDDKFDALQQLAEKQLDKPFSRRLISLRHAARELGLSVSDRELQRFLNEAQQRREGRALLVGRRVLDRTPTPWLVERLIMRGRLNLLVAPPKVGKTSLVLSLISRWSHGAPQFLGLALVGACPPVLILGPDQPECDWAAMLEAEGLLTPSAELKHPLIDLSTAGNGWALDEEGITLASDVARENPGLLIVIDSLRGAVRPLGLEENGAEADAPLRALIAALDGLDATVLMIHHSGKAPKPSPTLASRGSSAIAAAASQVIGLQRLDSEPGSKERRIVLSTEGRGGMPVELLIERSPEWGWIAHGDAAEVLAERRLQAAEEKLNHRQACALQRVRSRAAEGLATTAEDVHDLMSGTDPLRAARSTLEQLADKALVIAEVQSTPTSRRKVYRPRPSTSGTSRDTPEPSYPSEPSSLDASHPDSFVENPYGERDRRVRRDRRVAASVDSDGRFLSAGENGLGQSDVDSRPLNAASPLIGIGTDVLDSDEEKASPNSDWQAKALLLKTEHPELMPYTVAIELGLNGFHGITGKKVAELFRASSELENA